jgi:hypothetical protein
MRLLRTKTKPEGLRDAVTDSVDAARDSAHRDTLLKAALIAGGVAVLTAGSAAISSLRRRTETNR